LKFALSLCEQGFGSLLTLAVNLWLIRNGEARAYGTYVFWLSIAFATSVVLGTMVLAHLSRLPDARTHLAQRREPERFMLSLAGGIIILATLAVAGVNQALAYAGSELAEPAATVFIPGFLLFQYARTFAFSRQRPALAAGLTGCILVVALLLLAGDDFVLGHHPDAARVLLLTGLAFGLMSLGVVLVLLNGMGPMLRPSELRHEARRISGFGWLMLGAGSNEITGRLYSFVIVGAFGPAALAFMSAVQVLIRPAWLLSSAWISIGFPDMASRWARGDRDGLLRTLTLGGAVTALGSLIWSAFVVAAWPWISAVLYHGKYADIGPLAYLWGVNVVLGSLCAALNTATLALGEFRRLALIDLAGALVTVPALGIVVTLCSYPWAIVATVLGQAAQLALMALLVRRRLQHSRVQLA
jgi:O-antigen/teichoic acid export membrane protein